MHLNYIPDIMYYKVIQTVKYKKTLCNQTGLCLILRFLFMDKLNYMDDNNTYTYAYPYATVHLAFNPGIFILKYSYQPFYNQKHCDKECGNIDENRFKVTTRSNILLICLYLK